MEDLNKLKYKELQKLAKAAGIKANSPKAELVKALEDLNNVNEEVDVEKSSVLVDDIDENQQNKLNETFEKENSTLNITFEKNENDCDVTNDSQRTEDQSADAKSNLSSRGVYFVWEFLYLPQFFLKPSTIKKKILPSGPISAAIFTSV